ncbi:MAG TPA: TonB-dependent receptor [Steroidobacteraceae bacterium]|nr:TonB-dependent receptor [Steroidobacteraceae bacterium]
MRNATLAAAIAMALPLPAAFAQDTPASTDTLGEIIVTAQRRSENIQDVPISVSALEGERLSAMFEGGGDIQVLAARVPSLYAESSNGRLAPRFYIRGLGNSDFDLAASQPVSIIVDEVVLENVILKSFPMFDLERVEVLRGPQGTLFGRNTPAGIVKFDTKKPTQEFSGDAAVSYGELGSMSFEGAVGGGLSDVVSFRLSALYQERDDWIDNDFTGENDAMGGYDEFAYRAQLLVEPSDNFSALLNIHGRDIDGTASIFRANVLGPGSDGFNANYDRDSVTYDGGDNNPQSAKGTGGSLKLDFGLAGDVTLTSITAYETTESSSLGDIDGGFGAGPAPGAGPCSPGSAPGDVCIPFPSDTQDGIDDLDQLTQEIRLAAQASDRLFWQAGAFYFDSEFEVTTNPFFTPVPTTVVHENTAWAVFGHVSYDVTDALTVTGGARYTDDDKDLSGTGPIGAPIDPVSVADDQISWDLSALFEVSEDFNVYGRLANGFRAPTIQGRDVAFFGAPSIADSETITSIEAGFKSQLADNRVRLNAAVFYYEIEDQQLSAIGGAGNLVQLVNADKGTGMGFDLDSEFLITDRFMMTLGFSYTDTEIDDATLVIPPCGSGMCTVLDPLDIEGRAIVDGNSFTQAPEYVATVTARYGIPMGNNGELFFYTDWAFQGETNFFIYEAEEFKSDGNFEGGARIGYSHDGGKWEVAIFGRNITDEENVKGAIDFNNLTGFDNEPRIIGASFRTRF